MRFQGKISQWNDEKGFGFVEPNGGGDRAFVHIKAFDRYSRRPVDGDSIIYQTAKQADGRLKARNILLVSDVKASNQPSQSHHFISRRTGSFVILMFCLALSALVLLNRLPLIVLWCYGLVSCITFLAYWMDKSAAKQQRWRTRESTLHLLALFGGWPGAYYAQHKLRHKSLKAAFQKVFWLMVLLNLLAVVWLQSEAGRQLFAKLMH